MFWFCSPYVSLMQCDFNSNTDPVVGSGCHLGIGLDWVVLVFGPSQYGSFGPGAACTVKSLNRHWRPQLARKMKFVKLLPVAFRKWSPSEHCSQPLAQGQTLPSWQEAGGGAQKARQPASQAASRGNWNFGMENVQLCTMLMANGARCSTRLAIVSVSHSRSAQGCEWVVGRTYVYVHTYVATAYQNLLHFK